MSIFAWIVFGIVNSLVLYLFEKNKSQTSPVTAMLLGVAGALSGGTFAYLLFGDGPTGLSTTVILAVLFEIALLGILMTGKSFRKI